MIPAQFVAPYRIQGKSGKNDANDAAAVCEAASRPHMNFVPPKTLDQQGMLCVHRLREAVKEERTACINRIRGLLAEFGVVLPQKPAILRQHLNDVLEDASNDIAGMARLVLQKAQEHWRELEKHIQWCDERIAAHQKDDEQVQRAAELKGVEPISASAMVPYLTTWEVPVEDVFRWTPTNIRPARDAATHFTRGRATCHEAHPFVRTGWARALSLCATGPRFMWMP